MRLIITCAFVAVAAITLAACGEEEPKSGTTADAGADVDAGSSDKDVISSCKGVAQEHRRRFSQYDHQCSFLQGCAASGKCSCGKGCSAGTQLCNDDICKATDATCYCGFGCQKDTSKRPLCPEYLCKQHKKDEISGCEPVQGCAYVDSPQDDTCKCTAMPDHEPTCWCGDTCSNTKAKCSPALCFGKDPSTCIVVPGKKYDNCYCATCGLKGAKAACFFVLCP